MGHGPHGDNRSNPEPLQARRFWPFQHQRHLRLNQLWVRARIEKAKAKERGVQRAKALATTDRRNSPKFCKNLARTVSIYTSFTTPRRFADLSRRSYAKRTHACIGCGGDKPATLAHASQRCTNSTDSPSSIPPRVKPTATRRFFLIAPDVGH